MVKIFRLVGLPTPEVLMPEQLHEVKITKGSCLHGRQHFAGCIMQVVAWLAGEKDTTKPKCTDLRARDLMISVNDNWRDRQSLKEIAPLLVGFFPSDEVLKASWEKVVPGTTPYTVLITVPQAIIFVKHAHALMNPPRDSEVFTEADEQFLADVSAGKMAVTMALVAPMSLLIGAVAGIAPF